MLERRANQSKALLSIRAPCAEEFALARHANGILNVFNEWLACPRPDEGGNLIVPSLFDSLFSSGSRSRTLSPLLYASVMKRTVGGQAAVRQNFKHLVGHVASGLGHIKECFQDQMPFDH